MGDGKMMGDEKMRNLVILVADSLRFDYLPKSIKEKGTVIKTLTQATYTPPSFASLISGLSPENHNVRWFFDSFDTSKATVFDYFDNYCFFDHPTDPMSKIVLRKFANNLDLKTIHEPFVWVERLMDTHTPYGEIKHGNEIPSNVTHSIDRTQIGDPTKYSNLKKAYRKGVKSLEEHFWMHVRELKERGILDRTLVVLTSDHGELLGERVYLTKRRGHSWPICRQLVEVPTVFLNYKIQAQCMRTIDIVPTCLDVLGIQTSETFDGRSIIKNDVFEGKVLGRIHGIHGYYYISEWKYNELKKRFEPKGFDEKIRLIRCDIDRYLFALKNKIKK